MKNNYKRVDENFWLCRNCKHYHTYFKEKRFPENECANVSISREHQSWNCKCVKWESSDNLVYLEQKYKENDL